MKKTCYILFFEMLLCITSAKVFAQSQAVDCPGWNNPAHFVTNNSNYYYMGRGGNITSNKQRPNVMTGFTGINWNGAYYKAAQLDQGPQLTSQQSNLEYWCETNIPGYQKCFYILDSTYRNQNDPNTLNHLPYFPNSFNIPGEAPRFRNVIRIGDACYDGSGNPENNGYGAQALFYNMKVTRRNALLSIYFAVVVQKPSHGVDQDPSFIIRVTKEPRTTADSLTYGNQRQLSDTLAYMITSSPNVAGGVQILSNLQQNGWHEVQGTSSSYWDTPEPVVYKDWSKVSINLIDYINSNVRIEIMISDCAYNYHWAYAYIAGECQPMQLTSTGCPKGLDTTVAVIEAPKGLQSYQWFASEWGRIGTLSFDEGSGNEHVTWRAITSPSANGDTYRVHPSDFRLYRTINDAGDTITVDSVGNEQTFMCKMYSALDPSKPFISRIYTNITNTKPTMKVDTTFDCEGNIDLANLSYVPGQPHMVIDSLTEWYAFSNTTLNNDSIIKAQAFASAVGTEGRFHFDRTQPIGILAQTNTTDPECYSQAIYILKPKLPPAVGFTLTDTTLCDQETTLATDTTRDAVYREWRITGNLHADTLRSSPDNSYRQFTPDLQDAENQIELLAHNGTYIVAPTSPTDTTWCTATAIDSVHIFLHPDLLVIGDTIVCKGSTTDATVAVAGGDNCTFEWSRTLGSITGGLPSGNRLQVVPYSDTATYFVRVTSPQGCVAWDSLHAYMVIPQLRMLPSDGRICPGDTALLIASAADHYRWTASPADPLLASQNTADTIRVTPSTNTTYTLVGYGTNNCAASPLTATVHPLPYPTPSFSAIPAEVDADDPTVMLRNTSANSTSAVWNFLLESAEGNQVQHTFAEAEGADSVSFDLIVANAIGCTSSKTFSLPVHLFTAWLPNIFTPNSADENALFKLYTINSYTDFHIRIYDRRGILVFESTDPNFAWDGTDTDGARLPQAAYAYILNYRKPGVGSLMTKTGTVTLIR